VQSPTRLGNYSIIIFSYQQAQVAKKLIPLLDRVLIQRAEAMTKTAGGIVIPEKAQSKVLKGTIVAVGPGARNTVRETK
jgi:co-chaperonin GroES (HSP10)